MVPREGSGVDKISRRREWDRRDWTAAFVGCQLPAKLIRLVVARPGWWMTGWISQIVGAERRGMSERAEEAKG